MRGTQCAKCKWRGSLEGRLNKGDNIHCNYNFYSGRACTRRGPKGSKIDIRGTDKENCEMFEPGRPATHKSVKLTRKNERHETWLD